MARKPEELYLDLMKKTLSFMLWPEPPIPVALLDSDRPLAGRLLVTALGGLLGRFGIVLAEQRRFSERDRIEG